MALNLARSFMLHSTTPDISFTIFTDRRRSLPRDLRMVRLIELPGEHAEPGLMFKINFDQYLPGAQCLFIDGDCFIMKDLGFIFERFEGAPVGVVGVPVERGEWCGAQMEKVLKDTNFTNLLRFNGGLYYIDMCHPLTRSVFAAARGWSSKYDALGFARLGTFLNDEPLMALAFAEHSLFAVPDTGDIASDFNVARGSRIDVLSGAAMVNHPVGHPGRKWWYESDVVHPAIVHYGSSSYGNYLYMRETLKLNLVQGWGLPPWTVDLVVDRSARFAYYLRSGRNATTL